MPSKKITKRKLTTKTEKNIVEASDLLPESREFLAAKEEEEKFVEMMEKLSVEERVQPNEKEEAYKKMVMWSGISFFMLLILIIWGWNIKHVFKQPKSEVSANEVAADWQKLSQELNQAMQAFKTELNEEEEAQEAKDIISDLKNQLSATSTASTTATLPEAKATTTKK